ncbi:MAG: bifunctional adenosylcobinamide kinase/adenosylcobinamide-phosphate guanylyltransferase [Dehalococcoidia bacterium]|nr:bifunctional adenosylcobinamide kinase/adenosylcobinamide-phosphate guanylyltransferase [Dehalococcoidia bacterium]
MAKQCILLLGGARSGKSHYAQQLATELSDKVLFVATGEALDEEMQARIAEHKKARPKNWRTLEIPSGIGREIERQIGDAEVVIIDCLTLLVSNLLRDEPDYPEAEKRMTSEINELIAAMDKLDASFVIVSNEVGMGLVPETRLGRIYRDLLGKANQLLASHATEVYLMVACLPVRVKGQV